MPDIAERIEYNERDRSQHSFTLIGMSVLQVAALVRTPAEPII